MQTEIHAKASKTRYYQTDPQQQDDDEISIEDYEIKIHKTSEQTYEEYLEECRKSKE